MQRMRGRFYESLRIHNAREQFAMSKVDDLVSDLDAALERFAEASALAEQRRALSEALQHIYSLRAHREGPTTAGKQVYRAAAARDPDGRIVEGLAVIRGVLVHDVTKEVGPSMAGGAFQASAFDLRAFACGTLTWLRDTEMTHPLSRSPAIKPARLANYDTDIAGHPVSETLHAARRFLVESSSLPPL